MIWEESGPKNTVDTLKIALEACRKHGIGHIVTASNTGATVRKALELGASGLSVICVTHHVGFSEPGVDEMPEDERRYLSSQGVRILTTTHVLAGVDRGLRRKFGGVYPAEIIANALRMISQGLKVCVEISIMALDAGLVPYGKPIIAVGGSRSGADTAAVIVPEHSHNVFDLKVHEILCKPRA
ncbi:MAG: pyruvate kinase alpha/beta domain-containing protein [Bacillota bacterium]